MVSRKAAKVGQYLLFADLPARQYRKPTQGQAGRLCVDIFEMASR
jgi:hypothetical protein